jgi:hypothetical protein
LLCNNDALHRPDIKHRDVGSTGMRCARPLVGLLLLFILLLAPLPGLAQDNLTCPEIVRTAMATTEALCSDLAGNQACYGHVLVDARPRPEAEDFVFDQAGDIEDLLDLQALRLSAMDVETGLWGMALMNLQAYMLYSQPEAVTFLLVGDVEIENAVEPVTPIPVTVDGRDYVNVRLGPTTRAGVLGTLAPEQTVTAEGRLEDTSWLRVRLPDTGRVGWLSAAVVTGTEELGSLAVVEAWSPYYGPMQAFYLRTGVDESLCPEAAPSGLLIQTPEGVAEVSLLANEVNIQLRATVLLQAPPGGEMTVTVLEGWAEVEVEGRRQTAFAGTEISVPLNADRAPSAPPGLPRTFDTASWEILPIQLLRHEDAWSPAVDPVLSGDASTIGPSTESSASAGDDSTISPSRESPSNADDDSTIGPSTESSASADGDSTTSPLRESPSSAGDDSTTSPSTTSPDNAGDEAGDLLPAPSEPDFLPPGHGGTPPGLEGVVPPGMGGTPPGQGGTPPGQAK